MPEGCHVEKVLEAIVGQAGPLVLQGLLGLESQEMQALKLLNAKMDASLKSHYRAALLHLNEAASPLRGEAAREESLRLARANFIHSAATFQQIDPLRSSWAAVYVSGIGTIMGSAEDTRHWLKFAHGRAVEAARLCCVEANNRIDGTVGKRLKLTGRGSRSVISISTGTAIGSIGTVGAVASPLVLPVAIAGAAVAGGAFAYVSYRAKQERAQLEELDMYVKTLGNALAQLGYSSIPRYSLQKDDESHFQYV